MAIVSVTFDTSSKKLVVSLDGEELTDVCGVSFYESYDRDENGEKQFRCEIRQSSEDEEKEVRTYTCTMASEAGTGKAAGVASEALEFVKVPASESVEQDIAQYIQKLREKR